MAEIKALWKVLPFEAQKALDAQAGLNWAMTGVSIDEADTMLLAMATQEQRDAILEVLDDEGSAAIHRKCLELLATDLDENVNGNAPSIMRMRVAWGLCTTHVQDFLTAFGMNLSRPSRLNYLLLDIEEVVKEIHVRLNVAPCECTRQFDILSLDRLHNATSAIAITNTKRISSLTMPEMALELEKSRALARDAPSSGDKRQAEDLLIASLRNKKGCRGKAVGNPGESRNDLEIQLHDKWSAEAVLVLKELGLPIIAVAAETADSDRFLKLRFGNHRASTIKGRVMLWRRLLRIWLLPHNIGWPTRAQLIDLLEGTGQMSTARTWPEQVLGTIAFLEETGGIQLAGRLSEDTIVVSYTRALTTELNGQTTSKRQAPPLPLAVMLALELYVVDATKLSGMRMLAWVRLVKSWAGLRYHDHLGMEANSLRMDPEGLVFWLSRTKTSGPGKKIARLPVYVHKEAYLGTKRWLSVGFRIFSELKVCESRDYLLPSLESNYMAVRDTPMTYPEALVSDRILLSLLNTPFMKKGIWSSAADPLMPEEMLGYFSEHSERHFLPRLSIAAGFSREERDYLGRWSPSGADSYVTDSEQIVTKIQKSVALKLRMGDPDLHRNRSEVASMKTYLSKRGHGQDRVTQLMTVLEPKLLCMGPPAGKDSGDNQEADRDTDDIDEEIQDLQTPKPLEAVGFYPYWMARVSRKLHKTGATTCPWNPKGVATCVWIESEADARIRALTYCKKCWPSGFEDEASDSESLIDTEE